MEMETITVNLPVPVLKHLEALVADLNQQYQHRSYSLDTVINDALASHLYREKQRMQLLQMVENASYR